MAKTYQKADESVNQLIAEVVSVYHPVLNEVGARIGARMVYASRDKNGAITGPAIKHHGSACAATIRRINRRERVMGLDYDLIIDIDGDLWAEMSDETRVALLDHELTHPEPERDKDGQFKLTDDLRPVFRMRDDDWSLTGFREVLARHGMSSLEWQSLNKLVDEDGQHLFRWAAEVPDESQTRSGRRELAAV